MLGEGGLSVSSRMSGARMLYIKSSVKGQHPEAADRAQVLYRYAKWYGSLSLRSRTVGSIFLGVEIQQTRSERESWLNEALVCP